MTELVSWITEPDAWIALISLTSLEIVLGVDNIVFITILVGRLPKDQRDRARIIGLGLAMITRILLLLVITWVIGLERTKLFTILGSEVSAKDIILIIGGLFLIAKSVHEIHGSLEGHPQEGKKAGPTATMGAVLVQIALIDVVFSIDSVITAIGLAERVIVMILAIVFAIGVMMLAAGSIGRFVQRHPTIKMLALSFLILIGVSLLGEGVEELTLFGEEYTLQIPRGYIYFAMAFALVVELLNLQLRRGRPVKLHKAGEEYASSPEEVEAA